jgi:hypothetical protein
MVTTIKAVTTTVCCLHVTEGTVLIDACRPAQTWSTVQDAQSLARLHVDHRLTSYTVESNVACS